MRAEFTEAISKGDRSAKRIKRGGGVRVARTELPVAQIVSINLSRRVLARLLLTSQVTIGLRPILYNRVKKARAVKIRGAMRNSHSSRISRKDDS